MPAVYMHADATAFPSSPKGKASVHFVVRTGGNAPPIVTAAAVNGFPDVTTTYAANHADGQVSVVLKFAAWEGHEPAGIAFNLYQDDIPIVQNCQIVSCGSH